MRTLFGVLYGWVLTGAASTAIGSMLLIAARVRLRRTEHALFSFLLGSAGLSGVMFALSAVHLVRRGFLQALTLALVIASAYMHRKWSAATGPAQTTGRPAVTLFFAGYALFGAIYLFNALAPEVSPDGSSYHLEITGAYARAHGFERLAPTVFNGFPQASEMLFLFAYPFGRHSAAAMVHFSFLLALPLLVVSFGRRFGITNAAIFAGVLVFASPAVGIDGVSAYNDVALAAAGFGAFYLMRVWEETGQRAILFFAGLLAGFAGSIKYSGVAAVLLVIGFVLLKRPRQYPAFAVNLLTAVGGAVVLIAPWLVKNWLWTGNPVLPFLNRQFPNPFIHPGLEDALRVAYSQMPDGASRWKGLLQSVANGTPTGVIGPVFLLAPLAVLAVRSPAGRRLLGAAGLFLLGFVANRDTRFLIPVLPFAALALGMTIERTKGLLLLLAALHLGLSLYPVIPLYVHEPIWRISETPVAAALRMEPEDRFFERRIPDYFLARLIDDRVPAGGRVLAISAVPQAYTSREIVVGFQSTPSIRILDWIIRASLPPHYVNECRFQFEQRTCRTIRIVLDQAAPDWQIDELRFLQRGQEVMRAPKWRIRASPYPWEAQLAFDGNPLTSWSPYQPASPGMWVETDFGEPAAVDAVLVRAAMDQQRSAHIEVRETSGEWRRTGGEPVCGAQNSGHGLRRLAAQELKERRVGYLLVKDSDPIARDLFYNRQYWGISEIGEYAGGRLYRID